MSISHIPGFHPSSFTSEFQQPNKTTNTQPPVPANSQVQSKNKQNIALENHKPEELAKNLDLQGLSSEAQNKLQTILNNLKEQIANLNEQIIQLSGSTQHRHNFQPQADLNHLSIPMGGVMGSGFNRPYMPMSGMMGSGFNRPYMPMGGFAGAEMGGMMGGFAGAEMGGMMGGFAGAEMGGMMGGFAGAEMGGMMGGFAGAEMGGMMNFW